jgi:hypothetical protein
MISAATAVHVQQSAKLSAHWFDSVGSDAKEFLTEWLFLINLTVQRCARGVALLLSYAIVKYDV